MPLSMRKQYEMLEKHNENDRTVRVDRRKSERLLSRGRTPLEVSRVMDLQLTTLRRTSPALQSNESAALYQMLYP